jgi:PAS domain S-box-containing protein
MKLIPAIFFIIAVVYIVIGIYILSVNFKSRLNRIFFLMCWIFAIWSLSYTIFSHISGGGNWRIWYRMASFSYCLSPVVALEFLIILTGNERFLRKKWLYFAAYIPGLIFTYKSITGVFIYKDMVSSISGVLYVSYPDDLWHLSYIVYYLSYLTMGILLTIKWGNKSKVKREKKQSRIIILFGVISIIMLIVRNLVFSEGLGIMTTPILSVWWMAGMCYSILKYKMITPNLAIATKKIITAIEFLVIIDGDGKIIKINGSTEEMLGYCEDELKGKCICSIMEHEHLIQNVLLKMKTDTEIKFRDEVNIITKNGDFVPVKITISGLKDEFEDLIGFIVAGQDMREIKQLKMEIERRKSAEKMLRESEEKYRGLVELSPDSIFIHSKEGILYANKTGVKLLGAESLEDFVGKYPGDFVEPDYNRRVEEIIRDETAVEPVMLPYYNGPLKRMNGSFVDVEARAIYFPSKTEPFIMTISRDMTDVIQAERNKKLLEEAIKYDNLKNEFFSNISHEIRTPINVIFCTLQMLEIISDHADERVDKYIDVMKKNCYRLLKLTSNIIDITKIDSGFLQINLSNNNIVSLVEEITQLVAQYIEDKGINLIFDTDVEEKIMACDPDKIERIILNLLSNAFKFTEPGGSIAVNLFDNDGSIRISVKDTGIGIPEDKQYEVFKRFTQVDTSLSRNREGSGIGLAIVKSLVEMHGGTITLESRVGEGSEFIIDIPATILPQDQEDTLQEKYIHSTDMEIIKLEFSDIYM